MDPRDAYALGGIILLALVWLTLVPVAIVSGHKRRKREARTPSSLPGSPARFYVTNWQGFTGNLKVEPPQTASSNGPKRPAPSAS
jgi:hypothetical protein